jgi:hypothetical protein
MGGDVLSLLLGKNAAHICVRSAALRRRMRQAYHEGQIKMVYDIGAHRGTWSKKWPPKPARAPNN